MLQHTMAIRPIFHWTARRVKAHGAIFFAAFALLRMRRYRYHTRPGAEAPLSEARILAELRNVEVLVLRDRNTNTYYALPSAANPTQIRLYKAVDQTQRRPTVRLKEGRT